MRRSGRTTRQMNEAVQTLLTTGVVVWLDHAAEPGNKAQQHGWMILLRRLWSEHNLKGEQHGGNLIIDKKNWTLKLK